MWCGAQVRFRAKNARDWELVVDDDGAVCYVNRRTKERSYENPKLEKTRRLTQLEVGVGGGRQLEKTGVEGKGWVGLMTVVSVVCRWRRRSRG